MSCCNSAQLVSDIAGVSQNNSKISNSNHDIRAASFAIGNGLIQTDYIVPGMHCAGCISSIERGFGDLDFVKNVRANLSLKRVSVTWSEATGDVGLIDQQFGKLGFEHSPFDLNADVRGDQKKAARSLLTALGVAGFGAANVMLLSVSIWSGADAETTTLFHLLSGLIAVPVVAFSGQPFFKSALAALRVGRLNMDVPISLAVLLALGMSIYESLSGGENAYFDAAVMLLFFLLIGRYLDHIMRDKARDAVLQLNNIAPKRALKILEDDNLQYFSISEIEPGDNLRILAGERIPVDGEIVRGASDLDCSLVTGENLPVHANVGKVVEAGTLNLTGVLDIKALRDAKHSFLAEVAKMMEAAEKGRGRFTRIADKMASIYAPVVHLVAAISFIGWMIATGGDWNKSIYIAISVLIITCPCALALAVPVAHVVAAHRLFKEGIVISDGAGFERLEQVQRVVFDKTGTLTTGTPHVKSTDITNDLHMRIAKSLAIHSSHPASNAVESYFADLADVELNDIVEVPGCGVEALYHDNKVRLGRGAWVAEISDTVADETFGGLSFAVENCPVSTFQLSEKLRKDALLAVSELKVAKQNIEILSGDGEGPVGFVGKQLGIETIHDSYTPSDKVDHINDLRERGEKTLMVGDGLNDAAALSGAHVAMAPANACDVGRHAADFVFLHKSLLAVPFAINMAKRVGRIVRQNFALAIIYNLIAVPFAVAGAITPLTAAIAMSASSIVVVSNSMRLARS